MTRKEVSGANNEISNIEVVTSESALGTLAASVISQLPLNESADPKKVDSLKELLQFTHQTLGPTTVAFVYRRESYVLPSLDLLVLWPQPIQLRADARKMREIAVKHAQFVDCLSPTTDSFLRMIDCRNHPSAADFQAHVVTRSQQAASARLIACASLNF